MISRMSLVLGLCALGMTAAAQDQEAHGRVSFADENALVRGSQDDDWSFATTNALILPGDTVWADDGGALEIEFPGGSFVRMADGSKLDVLAVSPEVDVTGTNGSFYVHRLQTAYGTAKFGTPAATVFVDPGTQVRFDIFSEGTTTISVRLGAVRALTPSGKEILVEAGQRVFGDPGYELSAPEPFDVAVEDAFDSWNRDRSRAVSTGIDDIPIFEETYRDAPIGAWSLRDNGRWVYVDDTYYWKPLVIDYVPYRHGYWSYVHGHGHVWVGHHSFSYFTSHYGFWRHHDHHGWIWSYHHEYSPARVASYRYGDLFIWTPINIHGHPIHYYGHDLHHFGGVTIDLHFSSFTSAHHLSRGHRSVHQLQRHHLRDAGHHDVHAWKLRQHDNERHAWRGHRMEAREFTPERIVRGRTRIDETKIAAAERAGELELRRNRAQIITDRGRANVRNGAIREDRHSRVREVRLSPRVQQPRQRRIETRMRPARQDSERARTGGHGRGVTTLNNNDVLSSPQRGVENSPRDRGTRRIERQVRSRVTTTPRNSRSTVRHETMPRETRRNTEQRRSNMREQTRTSPAPSVMNKSRGEQVRLDRLQERRQTAPSPRQNSSTQVRRSDPQRHSPDAAPTIRRRTSPDTRSQHQGRSERIGASPRPRSAPVASAPAPRVQRHESSAQRSTSNSNKVRSRSKPGRSSSHRPHGNSGHGRSHRGH